MQFDCLDQIPDVAYLKYRPYVPALGKVGLMLRSCNGKGSIVTSSLSVLISNPVSMWRIMSFILPPRGTATDLSHIGYSTFDFIIDH